jgi:hypothetical protein
LPDGNENEFRTIIMASLKPDIEAIAKLNENDYLKKWICKLGNIATVINDVTFDFQFGIANEKTTIYLSDGQPAQYIYEVVEYPAWKIPVSTTFNDLRPLVLTVNGFRYWRRSEGFPFDMDFNQIGS